MARLKAAAFTKAYRPGMLARRGLPQGNGVDADSITRQSCAQALGIFF